MFATIDYNDPLALMLAAESDEDLDGESLYATNAERGQTWDNDRDDMLGGSPAELAYSMLDS